MSLFSLADKTAVVTGAGKGIGKSIAQLFVQNGAVVHILDLDREPSIETVNNINDEGVKRKSCDTFAPMRPYMATKDEIEDINDLRLWLKVNGELRQDGSTRDFIFGISYLVSYISGFMTLMPGDIISTGTPAGVGLGMDPPQYLKPGDEVELGIDGLGCSKQQLISYKENER